jgi:hypothetical protein
MDNWLLISLIVVAVMVLVAVGSVLMDRHTGAKTDPGDDAMWEDAIK